MRGWVIIAVMFAAVAVGGYFIWRSSKPEVESKEALPLAPLGGAASGEGGANPTPPPAAAQTSASRLLKTYKFPGILPQAEIQNKVAVIKTAQGEIHFEILANDGPKAASNFVYLAKEDFYDGLKFHRVEPWVIQGGDPNCNPEIAKGRCGTGGPGYKFEDEPVNLAYEKGIVAMANAGPNTNGSQFFILKRDTPLPPSYTVFGRVSSGIAVVEKIAAGDIMEKVTVTERKN